MFIPRLISGIVMVIIAIVTVNLGGYVLLALSCFLSLVGMMEMYRVFGINKKPSAIFGYVLITCYYLMLLTKAPIYIVMVPVLFFLCIMFLYVFSFPNINTDEIMQSLFGFVYPGILMSFLYLLRTVPEGRYLVWLIFLASWGSDTCAYCTGMICKKIMKTHQMTPILSPKKSVEGGIGGLAGATILGAVFGAVFAGKITSFTIPVPAACAIVCFAGGIVSMIGDLAASAVKRNHNIKDYGHLIPGHGGIMDRFDSIIFAAPVLYFIICFLQNL